VFVAFALERASEHSIMVLCHRVMRTDPSFLCLDVTGSSETGQKREVGPETSLRGSRS